MHERAYVAKTLEEFKAKLAGRDGVQFYDVDKRPFQQKMPPSIASSRRKWARI